MKTFCVPERFNTNISHPFFDYKITIINSYYKNTNSKGDFYAKTDLKRFFKRFLVLKINLTQICYDKCN